MIITIIYWVVCYVLYMALGLALLRFMADGRVEYMDDLLAPEDGSEVFFMLYIWHVWVISVPTFTFLAWKPKEGNLVVNFFRWLGGSKPTQKVKKEDYL